MLNKIRSVLVLVLTTIIGLLAVVLMGKKPKWVKEKEENVKKAEKKISKKEKEKEKTEQSINKAKNKAEEAVEGYENMKKEHDEKINEAGETNEKEEISDTDDAHDFLNDTLSDLHSRDG